MDRPEPAQIPALRALWKEAFGDGDAFLDTFFRTAYAPERSRCLVADGAVAAALYWFDCGWQESRVAYLYAVATAQAQRGKGYCHALMADTHRHLAAEGYAGVLLVPGTPSLYRFYESMGYAICTYVEERRLEAGDCPVPLREIGVDEYAALRRAFLPAGGVVQEGASLAFLQSGAALYAGPDFLLAARREKAALHGLELLGNTGAAPGILRALGCSHGTFRQPGKVQPFAMYLALNGSAGAMEPPRYFGLAFD